MQFPKLFKHAEVEYITPFIRLWMSFNNWYKAEWDMKKDKKAIKKCKSSSIFNKNFERLFLGTSIESKQFKNALENFITSIKETKWAKLKYNKNLLHVRGNNDNDDDFEGELLIPISEVKKYYISDSDIGRLFYQTLDNIYEIRNQIVHGDIDIDNIQYRQLVEYCYKILHPILNEVFLETRKKYYICESEYGTKAYGKYIDNNQMIVLRGSKICTFYNNSLSKIALDEREKILNNNAVARKNYYILINNIPFPSPSDASNFCLGSISNGQAEWKTEDGTAIK